MIETVSRVRISAIISVASSFLILSSCDDDIFVPNGKSINGCYYSGDALAMRLADGGVFVGNRKISSFRSGRDQSGSYIVFRPALHIAKINDKDAPIISKELKENYISTIVELGKVTILMPAEPLGQNRLVQGQCPGD